MDLQDFNKHTRCYNYDTSAYAPIARWKVSTNQSKETLTLFHTVVYVLKGEIRFTYREGDPETVIREGELVFTPINTHVHYEGVANSDFLLLRMNNRIRLCESYSIEQLYRDGRYDSSRGKDQHCILQANNAMRAYVESLKVFYEDGFKCRYYCNIKLNEFFVLLRLYYPKEDLIRFFRMILSVDTGFIEKVHLLHRSCKNAKDLATAMNYSQSGFTAKFKTVFGKSVYQWMKEQKTRGIYHEICTTNKNFSQIAEEFGFKNYNHFIEYCTINIGNPPGKLRKDPIRNRNAEKSGQNSE